MKNKKKKMTAFTLKYVEDSRVSVLEEKVAALSSQLKDLEDRLHRSCLPPEAIRRIAEQHAREDLVSPKRWDWQVFY